MNFFGLKLYEHIIIVKIWLPNSDVIAVNHSENNDDKKRINLLSHYPLVIYILSSVK